MRPPIVVKEGATGPAQNPAYAQDMLLVTAEEGTFSQELGGLLRLHHGFVALCCPVPEEGCRHIALLHVHDGLGHCKSQKVSEHFSMPAITL